MAEGATIGAVRIGLASPDTIRAGSSGEVTRPEMFEPATGRPVAGGLFCERIFGPSTGGACPADDGGEHRWGRRDDSSEAVAVCASCGERLTAARAWGERRERFGHVELAVPVPHPWFVADDASPIPLLLGLSRAQCERFFTVRAGSAAIYDLLRRLDLDELASRLEAEERWCKEPKRRAHLDRRRVLVERLRRSNQRPEWLMLTALPVLPPDLRPPRQPGEDPAVAPDLNARYARLIERNRRLGDLLDRGAIESELRDAERGLGRRSRE